MNLSTLVQKIWEERINQRIDSSFVLFGDLKQLYGLKPSEDFANTTMPIPPPDLCECLALESSLARSRRITNLSEESLARIECEITLKIRLDSFNYQFEKALSLYVKNKWIESTQFFLKAYQLSERKLAKAACLLNLILCYENLEISFTKSLSELKELLSALDGELSQGIQAQIQALELRSKWRQAHLSEQDFAGIEEKEVSQISYFLVYLKQIPYLTDPSTEQQIENFAKQSGHLFNKDFRLRTLTYQTSETDKQTGRLQDYIERIYLWTWKWMENPLRHNVAQIVQTIQDFPWDDLTHSDQLSLDDQSLFILSLGWLSYFDPSFKSIYKQAIKKFKFSTRNTVLMNERLFQDHLFEEKSLDHMNPSLLQKMKRLLQAQSPRPQAEVVHTSDMISVDLPNNAIRTKSGKTLHSKSLCTALKLLKENENVDIEIFYNQTLNPGEYDQFLHAPLISNILYKLNQLIKYELTVKQKQGLIFMEGHKSFLQIQYGDFRSELILQNLSWTKVVQQLRLRLSLVKTEKRRSSKKMFTEILNKFTSFTRIQIQSELQLSKSDANRVINEWLSQKWINKKGFGKRTVYLIRKEQKESA